MSRACREFFEVNCAGIYLQKQVCFKIRYDKFIAEVCGILAIFKGTKWDFTLNPYRGSELFKKEAVVGVFCAICLSDASEEHVDYGRRFGKPYADYHFFC